MASANHGPTPSRYPEPRFGHDVVSHPTRSVGPVRLIHTSDWHLGRAFHQVGLIGAQAAYLDHLVDVVRTERVDAVLVSGDVYDRAMPSPETVELLSEALVRLVDAGAQVVVSSGNHDSAIRLGFAADLLERAGVHLRTSVADVGRPVLLGDTAVHPLPYLEPALAADALGATERTHAGVLRAAMARVRADAAQRGGRTVVMAHAFVTGGVTSESERDISVGGVSAVPPEVFAGADYVALGHLHGRQEVAPGVRYSGSPVAMSFSEWRHRKGSLLVDLSGDAPVVEHVEAPVQRPLAVLRGTLDDLLADPAHVAGRGLLVPGHPHRPAAAARGDGPGAPALPAHPRAALRARGRHGSVAAVRRSGRHRDRRRGVLRLPRPRARRSRRHRRRAGAARRGGRGQPGRAPRRRRRGRRGRRVGGRRVRVHRLEIEAFGPFADRVVVDVDALAAEGLFLIHGPTGSGKTSLLDAICFALYADVPGPASKRGLRSDHAGPDAVPRGHARAHRRHPAAADHPLPRVPAPQEARHRRGVGAGRGDPRGAPRRPVGGPEHPARRGRRRRQGRPRAWGWRSSPRWCCCPQGDFAAFLRATPEDRREVLERLFDISAFSDVEEWLAQARRTAGADLEAARAALEGLLTRVEDVLADAHDAAGDPAASTAEVPPESVGTHLRAVAQRLDARVSTTMAAFDAASGAERAAAEALAAARALDDLRTRGRRAVARLEALEAARPDHVERVAALAAAERAAGLAGHLTALARATDDVRACRRQVERTRAATPPGALADLPDAEVAGVLARLVALDGTAAALAREADDEALRSRQRRELDDRAEQLTALAERVGAQLAQAEVERERLAAEVEERAAGAGRVPELEVLLAAARARLTVLDAAEHDHARAEALAPRHADLRAAALDRRGELLDLRQRRLDGMAAELARALADGDPCPVCGALEHPAPATVADPVLPHDIAAAEGRLSAAEAELRSSETEIESLRTRAGTRLASLDGADRDALDLAVAEATAALTAARADADAGAEVAARLQAVVRAVEAHRTAVAGTVARLDEVAAARDDLAGAGAGARDRVEALHAEHEGCPCGSSDPAEHGRAARALADLATAVGDLLGADARLASVTADLDAALATAGFADADTARAASLAAPDLARLRAARHRARRGCRRGARRRRRPRRRGGAGRRAARPAGPPGRRPGGPRDPPRDGRGPGRRRPGPALPRAAPPARRRRLCPGRRHR